MLDARLALRRGGFALEASLAVAPGEVAAVVGPNGAGKTTLLRCLAGLERIDAGRVELDGRPLDAPVADVWVPPAARDVALVFQDARLFPHRTALENAAFGLRARGIGGREARRRAAEWLERLDVAALASRRPAALSGGEAQRVALARALAPEPRLVLLDEPLSAVDAPARAALRADLARHLRARSGAAVLVTHDPVEAAVVADRLVVLEAGRVVQTGAIAALAARPRSPYVAELVGVNLFRGRGDDHGIALAGGGRLVVAHAAKGDVVAVVHPHAVALHRSAPGGSPRNTWPGRVESIEPAGDCLRVRVAGAVPIVAEVTPAAARELELAPGVAIWVSVKATEIDVSPAGAAERIEGDG